MSDTFRWRKMKKRDTAGVEALLRDRERWCVGACGKYLKHNPAEENIWILCNQTGPFALIIQSKGGLFPVFLGQREIPPPRFLRSLFGFVPVHSIQGITAAALPLERAMEKIGLTAAEKIEYELMCIDKPPGEDAFTGGPAGLLIRRPDFNDIDTLAALHGAYEQEEVLPAAASFSAAASRLNTERILVNEQVLVAETGGQMIGKINTSAASFTRYQIGGVYVHPRYRGLGIARRMTAELVKSLVAQGKGVSLFVRKSNIAARTVYRRLGFEPVSDYRINYY
ncbi:MAG: GNAT family N-acetyltransferase [Treponema sp.]|jgi:ribosomal protein S18 acetylase RimI-like enzyme|nr:GNAT family N-acetyltransferase [Treponema sp.]